MYDTATAPERCAPHGSGGFGIGSAVQYGESIVSFSGLGLTGTVTCMVRLYSHIGRYSGDKSHDREYLYGCWRDGQNICSHSVRTVGQLAVRETVVGTVVHAFV